MTNQTNHYAISKLTISLLFAFTGLMFSSLSFALSTDRDQPADIDADDVEINMKTGERVFIGNVKIIQGTLRIKADKLVAQYQNGELVDATAYGSPAKFRQRPDDKPDDVEGEGKVIYVNGKNNTLTLKKNARLKQGFDTAVGKEIFYNMENDTLKVKGGANLGSGKKKENAAKQKDEAFFNDDSSATTQSVDAVTESAVSTSSSKVIPKDELPEGLVLPKKQTKTKSERSRLIIVPK